MLRALTLSSLAIFLTSCIAIPGTPELPLAPFQLRGLKALFRIASPGDNKRLAYPWEGNLYILDQGLERRVPGTFSDLSALKWPKHSDFLYYTTTEFTRPSISTAPHALYRVEVVSGHKELLVESVGRIFDFAVSHESNRLVYLRDSDIYSQDLSPAGQAQVRRLTDDGMTEYIALSQDGQKLAYRRNEGRIDGSQTVWTMDLSVPNPIATRFDGLTRIDASCRPFWLENGNLIIPDQQADTIELAEVDVSLGTITSRTIDIRKDGEPNPIQRYDSSNDGSLIAVTAGSYRPNQLVLIDTATGAIVAQRPACEPLAWFAPDQLFCVTKGGYHLVGPDNPASAAPSDDPQDHSQ